ncbi:hypothetical protein L6452_09044 [Arctium lappa]|uniref:Uncharacterized protein n=1 Tax=Arctium lappa TaxID=4217 RepID=A0ACB9DJY2_ARCLA|nr:hypothetical protein L6452_09044 [Arctium lappa]
MWACFQLRAISSRSTRNQDQKEDKYKEYGFGSDETDPALPLYVASRVSYMLGDIAARRAFRFSQWLELVRKRSSKSKASGFPHRPQRLDSMLLSAGDTSLESNDSPPEQVTEISLWERLGKAAVLNVESSSFSWDMLSSLHHTEHSCSNDSKDDMNKALEFYTPGCCKKGTFWNDVHVSLAHVTPLSQINVPSDSEFWGVVFFALFNHNKSGEFLPKEATAVIKIASTRMATQSERLGYEFAKWLGVRTLQARVIHNCSSEWLKIKEAAEKARDAAVADGDEVGDMTCSELIEALELSRCLYLMKYI